MPNGKPSLLFTPGPLTTSLKTKQAMLKDWGSWDKPFQALTASVCQKILSICTIDDAYVCVPMQGSGTFSVEAAVSTLINRKKKLLIPSNGAYCDRIALICRYLQIETVILPFDESEPFCPKKIEALLKTDPDIDGAALVHCETSTGILNPVEDIANLLKHYQKKCIIDAMSTFGALPLHTKTVPFDALIASANKCLEGVPGMGFVICKKEMLAQCEDNATSLSLDLYAQWAYMNKTKQWRFTPPTHVVAAFAQALEEYESEGGLDARHDRYANNHRALVKGMSSLGFDTFLAESCQSPIITSFCYPEHPNFQFQIFYDKLHAKGFIIYPGKLTSKDTFRIGSIGHLFESDIEALLKGVQETLFEMNITMPKKMEEVTC